MVLEEMETTGKICLPPYSEIYKVLRGIKRELWNGNSNRRPNGQGQRIGIEIIYPRDRGN